MIWQIEQRSRDLAYVNLHLVSAKYGWSWAHEPVHEYVTEDYSFEGNPPGWRGGYGSYQTLRVPALAYVIHPADGDGGSRYKRDEVLLAAEVTVRPTNSRAWFYLGNTKRNLGDHEGAAAAYAKRLTLGGWVEEVGAAGYG